MNKSSNIFGIFSSQATINEKQMIVSLCLLFAFCSSAFIGIPIWFEDPVLLCRMPGQSEYFPCSEEQMCSQQLNYKVDPQISPISLVVELNLLCERKYIKRLMLTIIYLGGFLGAIMNFLVYIRPISRKKALACLGIVFAAANFCIVLFGREEVVVSFCLAIIAFTSIIGNAYGFIIINEYFSGDLAKASTIFMRLFWAVFGIFFGGFCYLIHSNWRVLFSVMGTLVLIDSLYLLTFRSDTQIKEGLSKAPGNVVAFLKELSHLRQIKINFGIYVFAWTASSITYNAVWLELQSLGGNFYLNMMMVSTIEIIASFCASYFSLKLNISTAIKFCMKTLVFVFLGFIFLPSSLENVRNSYVTTFSIFLTLVGKLLSEIVSNLTYVHAPKVTTDKFIPSYMVSVRLFSRICLLFLPYVNYCFVSLHLHAFVFLGLVWGCAGILMMFAKEVQPQGIEEILNEFKIDLVSRLSVFSASSFLSQNPEDFLKHYEVEETNLKEIQKMRGSSLHQSLIHVQREDGGQRFSKDDSQLRFG